MHLSVFSVCLHVYVYYIYRIVRVADAVTDVHQHPAIIIYSSYSAFPVTEVLHRIQNERNAQKITMNQDANILKNILLVKLTLHLGSLCIYATCGVRVITIIALYVL